MIFVHVRDDEDLLGARKDVEAIKRLARDEFGREVQVWTQSYVVCRDTEQEARDFWRHYVRDLGDSRGGGQPHALPRHGVPCPRRRLGSRARAVHLRAGAARRWSGRPRRSPDRFGDLAEAGFDGTLLLFPQWEPGLRQFGEEVLPLLEPAGLRSPVLSRGAR